MKVPVAILLISGFHVSDLNTLVVEEKNSHNSSSNT